MVRHCLLLSAVLLFTAGLAWPADLPANPGFEQAVPDGRLPADWTERSQVPFQKLSREARSGQYAAEVTVPPGAANPTGYFYSKPEPLPPTGRLTVSVWTRVAATQGGAYLKIYYLSGEKYDVYAGRQVESETLPDTHGEWRRLVITDAPPPDVTGWRISVEFSGVGTALFDDAAATLAPLEVLSAVSLKTASGKVVDLGGGRRGLLGPLTIPAPGQRVVASLQGKSALPQTVQVGLVWFQGARQLGVTSVTALAWQTPGETSLQVRALVGADRFRPVAFAESAAAWAAATVTGLRADATAEAKVAPVRLAPQAHPRLSVTAPQLQRLRLLLKGDPPAPLATAYKELIARADACAGEKEIVAYGKYRIPLPPAVPPRHEDNFPYWTGLSRALEIRIEALSTAYLLTGERKYADLAKTWMLAICDWPQWTDPDLDIADACLDTGHFCYAAAFTYDFCYDALTEAERLKLRGTLLDKGAAAVMRAGETGWARTMSWPNGFAVVMGGMGIAGMATLGDDERAEGYVQYSRRRLYEFLSAQDRDGGYVEGLLYGGYAISFTVPFAATLANHGDAVLIEHPYLPKTLRMAAYCLSPDGATSVNFCDASSDSRDYAALAAWQARQGDGLGAWYLQRSGHLEKLYEWTPPLGVLWYPDQTRPVSPDGLPAGAAYRDVGWAVLRSGFGTDDFLLALRSGYLGSHCHPDANSLMFNGSGQWLLRDPGYGVSPTSEHSTLLVNGGGQAGTGAQLTAFGGVGDLVYTAGDATPLLSRPQALRQASGHGGSTLRPHRGRVGRRR